MTNQPQLVEEEDCPCFMGGSCPTDYKHVDKCVCTDTPPHVECSEHNGY